MRTKNFFLLSYGFLMFSIPVGFTQHNRMIRGTIEDFPEGKVILFEALTRDTLAQGEIDNHQFLLYPDKGEQSGQALPALLLCLKEDNTQSSAAPIGIEDEELKITISGSGSNVYSGTALQDGFTVLLEQLRQTETLARDTSSSIRGDSIQLAIAKHVESFYLKTRNTKFNAFMALITLDFLDRKFIEPGDLDSIQRYCEDHAVLDSFDKQICDFIHTTETGWVGKEAPEFTGPTFNGTSIRLSSFIGRKPIIIDFWASWCGPCMKEMPLLKELYAEGAVDIIGVSIDDQRLPWEKAIERLNLPWTNVWDETHLISKQYHVISVPTKFIIDRNGVIAAHNPDDLRKALNQLD